MVSSSGKYRWNEYGEQCKEGVLSLFGEKLKSVPFVPLIYVIMIVCKNVINRHRETGVSFREGGSLMSTYPNPRRTNGARRDAIRRWVLATQDHCALCGKPVDKSLRTPHPMSAEVDEIIPVSKGGSPYDRDNVQLTHRSCNQRKSNKTQVTQSINQPIPKSRDW